MNDLTNKRQGSVASRLWGGTLWNLVGAVFNQGSTLIISFVAARLLGRESFGAFGALVTTISTVTGIASLGAGFTATRYIARFRISDPLRAGRVAGLCLTLSATAGAFASTLLVLLAPVISERVFHRPELSVLLLVSAAAAFFNVVNLTQLGVLAGLEEFGSIAGASAISGTLYLVLCGLGLAWFGVPGAIAGIVLSGLGQALTLAYLLVRRCGEHGIRPSLRIREEWPLFRQFALPAALPGLTTMPSLWISSMLLLQREDGYAQLGLFVAANNLRILVLFAPNMVAAVSLSLMNAEVGRGDLKGFTHAFWISLRTVTIVASSGVLLASLFSGTLMTLFGRAFLDGQVALRLLLLAVIPEVLWGVFSQVLATHERMWTSLFVGAVPRDLGVVLLSAILVPRFGAAGVAAAYAASAAYSALAGGMLISRSGLARPLAVGRA